jgi:hypothetical protein
LGLIYVPKAIVPVRRRHRFGAGGGGGPSLPAGNAQLISDLGGDSVVRAFYDGRNNATTTTWDDTRGPSGFGPQLTPSGSVTFSDVNDEWVQGAAANGFLTHTSALSDLNFASTDVTVVAIGKYVSSGGGGVRYVASVGTAINSPGIASGVNGATSIITAVKLGNGGSTDGGQAPTANRIVVAAGWSNSGTQNLMLDVPNDVRVQQNSAAQATGAMKIGALGLPSGGGAAANGGTLAVLIVCKALLDAAQVDLIRDYGAAHHSVVPV